VADGVFLVGRELRDGPGEIFHEKDRIVPEAAPPRRPQGDAPAPRAARHRQQARGRGERERAPIPRPSTAGRKA